MESRFARQSFLGEESNSIFGNVRVGIVGLGGGGSHINQQLSHIGIRDFVLADPDIVAETNLNRLVGATARDAKNKTPKTVVAERVIKGLSPKARVRPIEVNWQLRAEAFRDCDVIFGCVDSFREREELERFCRRFLLPYIDIGMDVHAVGDHYSISGQVALSSPSAPCLRCMGIITEARLAQEAARYGAAGDQPQVVWPNGVLASSAVGIFVQLITPWHHEHQRTQYLEYDGDHHTMTPSPTMEFIAARACQHFRDSDVGDEFYTNDPASRVR